MNPVEGFVHLYHVWGLWGLLTALIYGPAAYREWRDAGGSVVRAPVEYLEALGHHAGEAWRDVGRVLLGIAHGLLGIGHPPSPRPSPWRYTNEHMLMMGIAIGGVSRFLTALYWAERNRAWMNTETVWIPAVPVLLAILADAHHHHAAWANRPWISRWLKIAAFAWVALGVAGVGI